MMAFGLIALIAGAASALMFASIVSGALISLVLFYLAPLPLMVAAIGWGPLCASLGGIAAAIGLGALFGLPYCIAFAVTVALPAWWLGHLVLLSRQVGHVTPDAATEPPAEQGKMTEPPCGQRHGDGEGDTIGQAEDRAEADRGGDASDARRQWAPAQRRDHQRQRRQIEQQ